MFEDEARFGRISNPKRCWAPKGVRPVVSSHFVREYIYAYGAICPQDGSADFLILPDMRSKCMNIFLKELAFRYSESIILLILDGAPNHQARTSIPDNVLLAHLPPYSPELNPMEHIWEDMREKHFKNLAFNSLDAVEEKLAAACLAYESNREVVKKIGGFHWIINPL